MVTTQKVFLFFFFLLLLSSVYGQEQDKEPIFIDFTVDEDLFLLKGTDQFYSFGTKIMVGWEGLNNGFTNAFLPKIKNSHQLFEFGIVHKMYTPQDVHKTEVDSSDIPFCGVTYLSLVHRSLNPSKGFAFYTKLDAGVVGEISGAETFQNGFHSAIGNSEVQGWHNQIGNGLYLNYTATVLRSFVSTVPFLEAFFGGKGTVGTMDISFEGFVFMRIGIFNDFFIQEERPYSKKTDLSPFYNLADETYSRMKYPNTMWSEDPMLREQATKGWLSKNFKPNQFYLKFTSGGIFNVYDGEMQGSLISFESSPYTIPYDLVPKWQHRLSVGVVASYHFGSIEYTWDRITYQPENNFPPYYPKWGRFSISLNL